MTRLLVSVTSKTEALMALEAGVDLIDIKDPAAGALGALPLEQTWQIAQAVNKRKLVSATIGDLKMKPEILMCAIEHTAASGVDIVKAGFFGTQHHSACIRALRPLCSKGLRMIAVLFADQQPDFAILPDLAQAGFYGVMLDTVEKGERSLPDYISLADLQGFIKRAKSLQLQCGLAGSLRLEHVQTLAKLTPDYLGFRGALCEKSERKNLLEYSRVHELISTLQKNNIMAECEEG